jgi:hypothetical protein
MGERSTGSQSQTKNFRDGEPEISEEGGEEQKLWVLTHPKPYPCCVSAIPTSKVVLWKDHRTGTHPPAHNSFQTGTARTGRGGGWGRTETWALSDPVAHGGSF